MTIGLPDGPYDVILADPPWAWGKAPLVDRGAARAVEKEYPTMQPEEIKALPVEAMAADESVLLMWATSPKLHLALEVMAAWGFTFKTVAFTWVKTNADGSPFMGMGFYTRQNAEFVLLGTRGKKAPERLSKSVHSVLMAPRGRHSQKPEELQDRVDSLFGGRKVELFARRRREGWDVWGNDEAVVDV